MRISEKYNNKIVYQKQNDSLKFILRTTPKINNNWCANVLPNVNSAIGMSMFLCVIYLKLVYNIFLGINKHCAVSFEEIIKIC